MVTTRARNWCFTYNNYTDDDILRMQEIDCGYIIFGKEVGEQGTPHLQGYIEFEGLKSLKQIREICGERGHYEILKGRPNQAIEYCKKAGDYWSKGKQKKQGKRSDLDEIAEMARNGASIKEIANEFPGQYIRYHNGIEKYRNLQYDHRDPQDPPRVYWYWGLAGTGKTRRATELGESYYIKDKSKWWDGYEQQTVLILDEFDMGWDWRDFLKIIDRYPYQGQYKGGYIKLNSPIIVITSEFGPDHFWTGNDLLQVTRRLTNCEELISDQK